jgi:hypothetical protein
MTSTSGSDDPTGAQRKAVLHFDLSLIVAQAIVAEPHVCTTNAWRALICLPEVFYPAGEYVEGWIAYETGESQVFVVEHCWVELASEKFQHIIDPSIVFLVPQGQHVEYFAGVRRSWRETEALEGEWFPHVLFEDYGEDGLGHPGYRAAFEQASRYGEALAQASTPARELVIHHAKLPVAGGENDGVLIIVVRQPPPA